MKISVLIPSKNRLDLLRSAVGSILGQNELDFEVIVSDNASEQPYQAYVESLDDSRIKYFRHSTPVPVTENWSKALSLATGDYVLMLGDDDALAPAFADEVRPYVADDGPDVIYLAAFHYAYPGVFSPGDSGYVARLWWEFVENGDGPFCLVADYARELARSVLEFRHRYGYNAQHFLMRRSFIKSFDSIGGLYQSPYPDFFSAMVTFYHARCIVVIPTECVIIGISPKSFGAYYFSERQKEGFDFLDNKYVDPLVYDFLASAAFPGDFNNTNWLISAEMARKAVGPNLEAVVDVDRYHLIQILSLLRERFILNRSNDDAVAEVSVRLSRREGMILGLLQSVFKDASAEERARVMAVITREVGQYPPSGYRGAVDIGPHQKIDDAITWLKGAKSRAAADALAEPPVDELEPVSAEQHDAGREVDAAMPDQAPSAAQSQFQIWSAVGRRYKMILGRIFSVRPR